MFEWNNLIITGKYFLFIIGELLALFLGVSFIVALLQEFISQATIKYYLTKPSKWLGNILGALFGAVTPFCSCSTIPILVGLLNAGASFGATMSFLFASPLLNPVILALFLMVFGWNITIMYGTITFIVAVVIGMALETMGFAADYKIKELDNACSCNCCCSSDQQQTNSVLVKVKQAALKSGILFRQVLPYLFLGSGIGAFIYGFVPEEMIIRLAGPGNPWAIPVAAAIGVPMYIRVETILPISSVLLGKGVSLGALMALIIGGAGASIPEVTLLASIFKTRLVIIFVATVLTVAIVTGLTFQVLQQSLL